MMQKIIIPFASLVLGALLGHFLTLMRERKKALNQEIDQVISEIRLIVESANEYHTSFERNDTLALNIVFYIDLLDQRVQNIIKKSNKNIPFWRVRMAITKENFDKSTFKKQDYRSEILKNIRNVVSEIVKELHQIK